MDVHLDKIHKNLEDLLNKSEIIDLIGNLFGEFMKELKKRDDKIEYLEKLLLENSLEKSTACAPSSPSPILPDAPVCEDYLEQDIVSQFIPNNCDNLQRNLSEFVPEIPTNSREHIDLLLIGDSIIKYIDASKLSSGTVRKICIPGVRVDFLFSKIVELNLKYVFKRVVFHVGTNYIPSNSRRFIIKELTGFLDGLHHFIPETDFVLSEILPRTSSLYMEGIDHINQEMRDHSIDNGMGHIHHGYFGKSAETDHRSICWDGVHLNFHGVMKLQESLARFLRD